MKILKAHQESAIYGKNMTQARQHMKKNSRNPQDNRLKVAPQKQQKDPKETADSGKKISRTLKTSVFWRTKKKCINFKQAIFCVLFVAPI